MKKRLKLRMMMLTLLCAMVSMAWGADVAVTFGPSDFDGQGTSGSGSEISATKNGVTFACDKGYYYSTNQIRCYSSSKITISSSKTIKGISFTFTSTSYTGGLETSYTGLSTTEWEKTLSGQARITQIVVTTEGGSSTTCSVTYDCNGGTSGCPDNLTGVVSGSSITLATAPTKDGATFSGWNDGSQNYNAGASYTVNSDVTFTAQWTTAIEGGQYQLYNGDLVEGDYIIYYNGKAMNNTISNNRLGYTEVTPSGGVITDPDDDIVWHIAPNGDDWTIQSKETNEYVASTGSNNQAALVESVTDKAKWTVSGSFEFVNNYNSSNSRNANLRNNGTYGFACYGTSTGGALSLYKYVNLSGLSAPVISPDGSVFVESQEVTIEAEEGCDIYYTITGEKPTTSSTRYTGPFTLTATATVKAIATKDSKTSDISQAIFTKISAPAAPHFDPETGSTAETATPIAVGTTVNIYRDQESLVTDLIYTINNGEPKTKKNVNLYSEVPITEEMVDEDGFVTIVAHHNYKLGTVTVDGAPATAVYRVVDPKVTFDPTSTVFAGEQIQVTLAAEPEDATIYYTTDGSTPTTSSSQYNGAFTITSTTTIKAIAVVGDVNGDLASATYTKDSPATSTSGVRWTRINSYDDLDAVATNKDKVIFTNRVVETSTTKKYAMPSSGDNGVEITIDDEGTGQYVSISDESKVSIFNVEKVGDYYRFKVDGTNKYLCANTSTTITPKAIDNTLIEDYNATITIGDGGKENSLSFAQSAKSNKNIRYNPTSNHLFRIYQNNTVQGTSLYSKSNVTIDAVTLYEKPSDFSVTSNTIEEKSGVTVNLYRSLSAGMWNAICLPFSMTDTQMKGLFGDTYSLQEFAGVETTNGATHLKFSEATSLEAGKPYIVNPSQNVEKNAVVVIRGVNITSTTPQVISKEGDEGDYTFQGIYNPYQLEKDNKRLIFIGRDNKFFYPTSTNPMMAFRAYFTFPEELSTAQMYLTTDEEGVADSISLTEVSGMAIHGSQRVYSVSGQLMGTSTEGLPKGIYIMNGKKFVVK